jgi:hypothetical protein
MKNKLIWALTIIVGLLVIGGLLIAYIDLSRAFKDYKNNIPVSDTVYVKKYYTPEKEYQLVKVPQLVTFYLTDTLTRAELKVVRDTIEIHYPDSTFLNVSKYYLTQYPQNDKLIQMLLGGDKMNLTLLNINGEIFQEDYSLDFEKYSYNYLNNELTFKKKNFLKRFHPFVEITARPIHNNYDLGLGLNYKTGGFNYELGLNGYYYHLNSKPWNYDVFLRVRYEF